MNNEPSVVTLSELGIHEGNLHPTNKASSVTSDHCKPTAFSVKP